jgi:hypothetical protein
VGGLSATQNYTLVINQPAAFTSAASASFLPNTADSFTVTTTGYPAASLSETGALPTGVTFVNNVGTGTATIAGTPTGAGGSYPLTITAVGSSTVTQSFTLGVQEAPSFTSAATATFTVGKSSSTTIKATAGYPTGTVITESGTLPTGVSFTDTGGSATLSGTPGSGTGGSYPLSLTASAGVGGLSATQNYTLVINQPAAFTSAASASFLPNTADSFTVTTTGYPTASLSETGALPTGVTFTDNHDGTATIAGTPTAAGTYPITITGVGSSTAKQSFTLTVS